jgi:hypothetical protein
VKILCSPLPSSKEYVENKFHPQGQALEVVKKKKHEAIYILLVTAIKTGIGSNQLLGKVQAAIF